MDNIEGVIWLNHIVERKENNMQKSKLKKKSVLPRSLHELVEFFDTHDMGEHWDDLPEAHFKINLKKRTHLIALDEKLWSKVAQVAQMRKMSSETLINTWVKEKLHQAV